MLLKKFTTLVIYASLAQSVEHAAVNRRVVGSSPTRGAIREKFILNFSLFIVMLI